jgi:hypothetical protein
MRLFNRIRVWTARRRLEAELSEEMAAHCGMLEEKRRSEGRSSEEAHLTARRQFGGDLVALLESNRGPRSAMSDLLPQRPGAAQAKLAASLGSPEPL